MLRTEWAWSGMIRGLSWKKWRRIVMEPGPGFAEATHLDVARRESETLDFGHHLAHTLFYRFDNLILPSKQKNSERMDNSSHM